MIIRGAGNGIFSLSLNHVFLWFCFCGFLVSSLFVGCKMNILAALPPPFTINIFLIDDVFLNVLLGLIEGMILLRIVFRVKDLLKL